MINEGDCRRNAEVWRNRGRACLVQNEFEAGERCFLNAIGVLGDRVNKNDEMLLEIKSALANLYIQSARYEEAELVLTEAIADAELAQTNGSVVALLANNYGGVLRETGRIPEALAAFERAAAINRQGPQPDEMAYAQAIENIALCLGEMAEYERAKALFEEALQIILKEVSEDHFLAVRNMNNQGLIYHLAGDYTSASYWFNKSAALTKGRQDMNVLRGIILNNQGRLAQDMGEVGHAESVFQEALQLLNVVLGREHPFALTVMSNIGMLLLDAGNYEQAEPLLQHVASLREFNENPREYATSINILGLLYLRMRRMPEAKACLERAIQLNDKSELGLTQLGGTVPRNNLALVYLKLGELAAAQRVFEEVLTTRRKVLGARHPMVEQALFNLATTLAMGGEYAKARHLLDEAAEIDEMALDHVFTIAADHQRSAFLSTLRQRWNLYLTIVRLESSQEAIRAGFNFVLRRRALGLEALVVQAAVSRSGQNTLLATRFQQLNQVLQKIAEAQLAELGADRDRKLAELSERAHSLERELATDIPALRLAGDIRRVDIDAVAAAMPDRCALIEFALVDVNSVEVMLNGGDRESAGHYLAFVLTKDGNRSAALLFDLGAASTVEQLVLQYRLAIGDDAEDEIDPDGSSEAVAGEQLFNKIVRCILPALRNCLRIIVVADGALSRLPLSVLPCSKDKRLIDMFVIDHLTTGRALLAPSTNASCTQGAALVLGDPDFDAEGRGIHQGSLDKGSECAVQSAGLQFDPLPGTRREAESVSHILGVLPCVGQSASFSVLSAMTAPVILHIATHGFFVEDPALDDGEPLGELQGSKWGRIATTDNPMLRSGLALAGANAWIQDRDFGSDLRSGIATAADLATLDLHGTELVTLSACETGLGVIHAGEGVFGLQRAFLLAGAKTLVMSLWKIPDEEAAILMERFYTFLNDGYDVADALRRAQQEVRQARQDPLYWGAFVCLGAARTVSILNKATVARS